MSGQAVFRIERFADRQGGQCFFNRGAANASPVFNRIRNRAETLRSSCRRMNADACIPKNLWESWCECRESNPPNYEGVYL